MPDMLTASRLEDAAHRAHAEYLRLDTPAQLPPATEVRLLFIDWSARDPSWGDAIRAWLEAAESPSQPAVVIFGPHTDLEAHAAARAAGLGPMRARSALFAALPDLLPPA